MTDFVLSPAAQSSSFRAHHKSKSRQGESTEGVAEEYLVLGTAGKPMTAALSLGLRARLRQLHAVYVGGRLAGLLQSENGRESACFSPIWHTIGMTTHQFKMWLSIALAKRTWGSWNRNSCRLLAVSKLPRLGRQSIHNGTSIKAFQVLV